MHDQNRHLLRERITMVRMVNMYCKAHHHGETQPCAECSAFLDYAEVRLDKCPYGNDKPTCSNCPVHCYKPERREQAKAIMRYAGPRMLLRHPWLAITHMLDGFRKAKHPGELTRAERIGKRKR